jgi:hypothetical protein
LWQRYRTALVRGAGGIGPIILRKPLSLSGGRVDRALIQALPAMHLCQLDGAATAQSPVTLALFTLAAQFGPAFQIGGEDFAIG